MCCMHTCMQCAFVQAHANISSDGTRPNSSVVCAGEMQEVAQSRSETAVSDRDPLSQPVHCE